MSSFDWSKKKYRNNSYQMVDRRNPKEFLKITLLLHFVLCRNKLNVILYFLFYLTPVAFQCIAAYPFTSVPMIPNYVVKNGVESQYLLKLLCISIHWNLLSKITSCSVFWSTKNYFDMKILDLHDCFIQMQNRIKRKKATENCFCVFFFLFCIIQIFLCFKLLKLILTFKEHLKTDCTGKPKNLLIVDFGTLLHVQNEIVK